MPSIDEFYDLIRNSFDLQIADLKNIFQYSAHNIHDINNFSIIQNIINEKFTLISFSMLKKYKNCDHQELDSIVAKIYYTIDSTLAKEFTIAMNFAISGCYFYFSPRGNLSEFYPYKDPFAQGDGISKLFIGLTDKVDAVRTHKDHSSKKKLGKISFWRRFSCCQDSQVHDDINTRGSFLSAQP